MTVLNQELYAALIDAGTSEDLAINAASNSAESLSEINNRLVRLEVMVGVQLAVSMGTLWIVISKI